MQRCVSEHLRRVAALITGQYSTDSPYINQPIYYKPRLDQDETKQEIQQGPPSMYDEPDSSGRSKRKEDIRRQGPRPQPHDPLTRNILPVTVTVIGEPREDCQGGPWNDTTKPGARNEDRETIGFDPDELTGDPFSGW